MCRSVIVFTVNEGVLAWEWLGTIGKIISLHCAINSVKPIEAFSPM